MTQYTSTGIGVANFAHGKYTLLGQLCDGGLHGAQYLGIGANNFLLSGPLDVSAD